jgi:serine/threonine-protein kinase
LPIAGPAGPVATKSRRRAGMVVAALTLAAVTGLGAWWLKPAPSVTGLVTRFQHPLPEGQQFTRTGRHIVAISPDGSKIAYVANAQLYLRDIGQLDAQPIRGTQEDPVEPVFSPDSQSIAYFAGSDSGTALKRVAVSGGTPLTLCSVTGLPFGVSWRNGLIAYGQRTGIEIVPDSGGTSPRTVVTVDVTQRAVQPQLLDDGKHVLFTIIAGNATGDEGQVVIQSLDGVSRTEVMRGGSNAQVLPTGHLIYIHNGTLFAVRFDSKRQAVTGAPVPIMEGVSETAASWAGNFSVSLDGSFVYRPGLFSGNKRTLAWLDRQGHEQATAMPFRDHAMPRLSPDGTKILVTSSEGETDIWVWNIAKETPTRLTFGPAVDAFAIWMPDSRRVIFRSTDGGRTDIYRRMADGTGELEPLTKNGTGGEPESVSPDGKFLVYRTGDPATTGSDLRLLPLDGTGESMALLADPKYNEFGGDVSPDGRWIAYQSNEATKNAIYVRPFPNVNGGKWMVSAEGGTQNRWSRSGHELFYVIWPRLYRVAITPGAAFVFDKPQLVVENLQYSLGPYNFGTVTGYDVAADGRFLFAKSQGTGASAINALVVVTHWFDELKARMSAK